MGEILKDFQRNDGGFAKPTLRESRGRTQEELLDATKHLSVQPTTRKPCLIFDGSFPLEDIR